MTVWDMPSEPELVFDSGKWKRIQIRDKLDRNPATRTIIAVDGEGWDIPLTAGVTSANLHVAERGWHSYVMLAAADDAGRYKTLVHDGSRRERADNTARNYGLPTKQSCDFLLALPADAVTVSFYFSYDGTKIFADMPLENLAELSNEGSIPQEEYEQRVLQVAEEYNLSTSAVHHARMPNQRKMVEPASTVWDGYWISYTPRKRLDIVDLRAKPLWIQDHDRVTGKLYSPERRRWPRKVTVWDAFGFFQKSFAKALADYRCGQCAACKAKPQQHCERALWSADDLARIETMKAQRSIFDASRATEIEQYCIDECRYLSFLMRDLLVHVQKFGLELRSYHGSGALASAWMRQKEITAFMPVREPGSEIAGIHDVVDAMQWYYSGLPEEVMLGAYIGGRFEISEMGFMGDLYGYDIRSAYPHIIRSLPCLAHGRFRRVSEYQPGKFGVYLAGSLTAGFRCGKCEPCKSLSGKCVKTRFAPFAFRTSDTDEPGMAKDAIYYCHGGKRWVWQDELAAARKHFGTNAIPVHDGYVWEPECGHKPFASVPNMYFQRQQYKDEGSGIEKVIKLILNSLYGKTAQSLGWTANNGEPEPPTYQCYIWAGMITSGCRAMIIDAFMQPDADVKSIATDGILSRTPIAALRCSKELGDWEYGEVTDAYLFQSGVYTMLVPCKAGDDCAEHKPERHERAGNGALCTRIYKTRGFASKEIPAQALIDAWHAGELTVNASPDESRFVPMKSGVLRTEALEYIGQWVPSEHDVSFTHNRRLPLLTFDDSGPVLSGLIPLSEPHVVSDDALSMPYVPKQTWQDVLENQPLADEMDYEEVSEHTRANGDL